MFTITEFTLALRPSETCVQRNQGHRPWE